MLLFNPRACCKGSGCGKTAAQKGRQAALTHAVRAGHQGTRGPSRHGQRMPAKKSTVRASQRRGHRRAVIPGGSWSISHSSRPSSAAAGAGASSAPCPPVGKSASSSHPRAQAASTASLEAGSSQRSRRAVRKPTGTRGPASVAGEVSSQRHAGHDGGDARVCVGGRRRRRTSSPAAAGPARLGAIQQAASQLRREADASLKSSAKRCLQCARMLGETRPRPPGSARCARRPTCRAPTRSSRKAANRGSAATRSMARLTSAGCCQLSGPRWPVSVQLSPLCSGSTTVAFSIHQRAWTQRHYVHPGPAARAMGDGNQPAIAWRGSASGARFTVKSPRSLGLPGGVGGVEERDGAPGRRLAARSMCPGWRPGWPPQS